MTDSLRQSVSAASHSVDAGNRLWTLSNLLSIVRIALVVPFVIVMLSEAPTSRMWGVILLAIAVLTDKLDGVFARKFNEVTEWGKALDPLADKIGVAALVLVLVVLGSLPFWFALAVLARDVLILFGGIYLRWRKGIILQSNEAGKWAVAVVTIALFLALIEVKSFFFEIAMWASVAMLVVSFVLYMMRFREVTSVRDS
ncbi:MAG: CDP-alcohol phosphatidyltransferase family protein [Ignavibacteriae bacterium]|nr:CDP-alcohol phosphatidyltransferase family protein [Ignavibacteriota bacterium]